MIDRPIKCAKAAVLTRLKCPLEIMNIDIPELRPGQVLVKVMYSGVCRSQLMEVRGGRGSDQWLPHLLGHEGSGKVLSVGKGVTKVCPGDGVIMGWLKGEGMDSAGATYKSGELVINSGKVTTFSNYTIVSENRLVKKPGGLSYDTAVLFGCALPTGAGMVFNEPGIIYADAIAVIGLGGIGLSALLALTSLKVKKIIAIDFSPSKLEFAKKLGATDVVNSNEGNVREKLFKLTGEGVDFCIESGGETSTIELGFSIIKKTGKLIFASHPPDGQLIKIPPHELILGKKIFGSWGGGCKPDRDIQAMYQIFKKSKAPLGELITKKYKLEEINLALDDLEQFKVFRPLIKMDH